MSEQDVVFSDLVLSMVTPEKIEVRRFTPFEELEEEPIPEKQVEPVRTESRRSENRTARSDGDQKRQGRKRTPSTDDGAKKAERGRRPSGEGAEPKEGRKRKRRRRRGRGKEKNDQNSGPEKKQD